MTGWTAVLAGASATLLGIGLQRFAYGPILPAMVKDGWLAAGPAGMLGGANLAGYLVGAFAAGMVARACGMLAALRGAMLLSVLGFALCTIPGGFWWFLPWRVLAGFTGGVLMVLAGPAVQAVVPPERRGLASGLVITGVGIGIMAGAALVPLALPWGLSATWLALAGVAALLTVLAWPYWPRVPPPGPAPGGGAGLARGAALFIVVYGLSGLAASPHMVFWPDYIVRGLGQGTAAGAAWWLVFGIGTCLGGVLLGRAADRFGAQAALRFGLVLQAFGTGLPLLGHGPVVLALSSLAAGATVLGITVLALVRARGFGAEAGPRVWRLATGVWGAATAAAGFGLSWLLTATGGHLPLFACGFAAALAALALSVLAENPTSAP